MASKSYILLVASGQWPTEPKASLSYCTFREIRTWPDKLNPLCPFHRKHNLESCSTTLAVAHHHWGTQCISPNFNFRYAVKNHWKIVPTLQVLLNTNMIGLYYRQNLQSVIISLQFFWFDSQCISHYSSLLAVRIQHSAAARLSHVPPLQSPPVAAFVDASFV